MSNSANGGPSTLGEKAKAMLAESFERQSERLAGTDYVPPQSSSPITADKPEQKPSSSPTPQRGLTVNDGTTKQIAPFQQLAEQNSNCNRWRAGFAGLMVVLMSATRAQPLSETDLEVWARILSRYPLNTLEKAVEAFIDTGDNFPSAGKIKQLAKSFRADELGIPRR